MPLPELPPDDPRAVQAARRKVMLAAAVAFLLLAALVILVLPVRLPLPLRLAVAGTDLIAAAIIALLLRQQSGR